MGGWARLGRRSTAHDSSPRQRGRRPHRPSTSRRRGGRRCARTTVQFNAEVVSFDGASFESDAAFARATFRARSASFDGARFNGKDTSFNDARFAGEHVSFRRVGFSSQTASFGRCQVPARVVRLAGRVEERRVRLGQPTERNPARAVPRCITRDVAATWSSRSGRPPARPPQTRTTISTADAAWQHWSR